MASKTNSDVFLKPNDPLLRKKAQPIPLDQIKLNQTKQKN
jgi:hypothetical protein